MNIIMHIETTDITRGIMTNLNGLIPITSRYVNSPRSRIRVISEAIEFPIIDIIIIADITGATSRRTTIVIAEGRNRYAPNNPTASHPCSAIITEKGIHVPKSGNKLILPNLPV